jgi:serine/threonine-protein kinase
MELMEGESLSERLSRVGRLSIAETSQIVAHVARALTRAHEIGIVHRDLKPGNVFLVRNEDEPIAKVLDFGIAKWTTPLAAPGNLTGTNAVMGTPYYMSPEQLTGARQADHRTDLWALGVIAFECLCGVRPFSAENMMGIAIKINAAEVPRVGEFGLPASYDDFFGRALARSPDARFQSARELSDELRRLSSANNLVPLRPSPPEAAAATLGQVEAANTGGPSSRTVTAVAAVPAGAVPRSRAPWLIAATAVGVLGVAAFAVFGRDQEPSLAKGVSSAPSALLGRAEGSTPNVPPPRRPETPSERSPAVAVVTPMGDAPSTPTRAPVASVTPQAPQRPQAPRASASVRIPSAASVPKLAAPASSRSSPEAVPSPADVFDSRH